jgi:fumarylpyruvate hydrolase
MDKPEAKSTARNPRRRRYMAEFETVIPVPELVSLPVVGTGKRFPVRRIYCVGRNYLEHIREHGNDESQPPFFFAKHRDTIVPNGSEIAYPSLTNKYEYELEMVVAMKSGGVDIPENEALSHVYGYAVGLDMTRRDLQVASRKIERPWEIGKSFDESAPCSAVTPAEQCGHLAQGRIWLKVNGEIRQDGDLAQMIWDVPGVISRLSREVGIAAGDLIFTGTPGGVATVVPGDTMVGGVDGLEELTIKIVDRR